MDAATFAPAIATGRAADTVTDEPPLDGAQLAGAQLDSGRVRDIVLVRIATAGTILTRADLSLELWPIVSHLVTAAAWHTMLDRDLGALADAGLCDVKPVAVAITAAGSKRAALVLGVNALPRTWTEARAVRLVAKALGLEALPPRRLKALAKADGLRGAIVQQAFKIKTRGLPTPAKLRIQLAALALSQAFGNTRPAGIDARSGLSAKAGRGLAGRLAHPPRDFPTDARLIAALAIEHAGATKADFVSLQTALLRRYVTRGAAPRAAVAPKPSRATKIGRATDSPAHKVSKAPQLRLVESGPPPTAKPASLRPDFATFVAAVRAAAHGTAEGWPGNRKAFVSRVWDAVQAKNPAWAVSAIEFKAMLVEAHRMGEIALANADLKDQRAIAELQASAIAYKNAIFHYVRADD